MNIVLLFVWLELSLCYFPVCSDEVGIGSWFIKESAFTASSYKSSRSYPWMSRLGGRESWCPAKHDTQPFLQVSVSSHLSNVKLTCLVINPDGNDNELMKNKGNHHHIIR